MEDYLISDERPLGKSIRDIAQCDVFISIIGWRYGYIPKENNPEHLSIIELEYRLAQQYAKPCLIFLLSEEASWPAELIDFNSKRIKAFRDELMRTHVIDTFRTIDELSAKVSSALQAWQIDGTVISKEQASPSSSIPKPNLFDVFLCHNSEDKTIVRLIAKELKKRDVLVWLDEEQLIPGQPWAYALDEIYVITRAAAVLVGKDGLGPWQQVEVRACLNEFVNRGLPVIPVLLPSAPVKPKLPLFLKDLSWVDLRNGLTENGLNQLEWGITGIKPNKQSGLLHGKRSAIQTDQSSVRIFICYSHKDSKYLGDNSLLGYLSGLKKERFEFWHDQRIKAGDFWDDTIKTEIERADIALVFVSQAFLNSKYCIDEEVEGFLLKRRDSGLKVFPVILSPCDWSSHNWLAATQFEPRDNKSIARNYQDKGRREELFLQILLQLRTMGLEIRDRN